MSGSQDVCHNIGTALAWRNDQKIGENYTGQHIVVPVDLRNLGDGPIFRSECAGRSGIVAVRQQLGIGCPLRRTTSAHDPLSNERGTCASVVKSKLTRLNALEKVLGKLDRWRNRYRAANPRQAIGRLAYDRVICNQANRYLGERSKPSLQENRTGSSPYAADASYGIAWRHRPCVVVVGYVRRSGTRTHRSGRQVTVHILCSFPQSSDLAFVGDTGFSGANRGRPSPTC